MDAPVTSLNGLKGCARNGAVIKKTPAGTRKIALLDIR